MSFGLQLDKLKHIPHEEFEELNWLPVSCRFKYCVSSITLRYFNEQPNYLSEVFDVATRKNCRNLKCLSYTRVKTVSLLYLILIQLFGTKLWIYSSVLPTLLRSTDKHNLRMHF